MKTLAAVMMLLGGGAYYWCSQQASALEPVPHGVEIVDALKYYPAARFEVGRYAGMACFATGLVLFFMPSGRA
jgi:hypothetical protein